MARRDSDTRFMHYILFHFVFFFLLGMQCVETASSIVTHFYCTTTWDQVQADNFGLDPIILYW